MGEIFHFIIDLHEKGGSRPVVSLHVKENMLHVKEMAPLEVILNGYICVLPSMSTSSYSLVLDEYVFCFEDNFYVESLSSMAKSNLQVLVIERKNLAKDM